MLDANWINALKLPTKVLTGLFIASVLLLVFDKFEILQLSVFGEIAKPIVILVCVLSGALSLTAITSFFIELAGERKKRSLLQQRREMRKAEQEEESIKKKQRVLDRISHLSNEELGCLAGALRENSQSFTTWAHSAAASTLITKGLTYSPGGVHHQDYYPFVINDFVWKHLLENKEEIIGKDDENRRIKEENKRNARHRGY